MPSRSRSSSARRPAIPSADAGGLERERDVRARVEMREQREVLEDEADRTDARPDEHAALRVEPCLGAEADEPVIRTHESGDRAQQRRLAGAGETGDREGLGRPDRDLGVQCEVAERDPGRALRGQGPSSRANLDTEQDRERDQDEDRGERERGGDVVVELAVDREWRRLASRPGTSRRRSASLRTRRARGPRPGRHRSEVPRRRAVRRSGRASASATRRTLGRPRASRPRSPSNAACA